MDPITHGLLGATTAQIFWPRKIKPQVWLVGALAAMSPDLDVFINTNKNPLLFFIYHRHFTHSLVFIPIGSLIIAGLFCLFKTYRQQWRTVIVAAFLGFSTHCLLDACTSYGTVLFWPFSLKRYAWDIISIVDPVFTLVLMLGIIASVKFQKIWQAEVALIFSGCYLLFGIYQHHRASEQQLVLIQSRHQQVIAHRVMPALGQLYSWHSFYRTQQSIYLDRISTPMYAASSRNSEVKVPLYTSEQLPNTVKNSPLLLKDFDTFVWFTDGYIAAFNRDPLILADLRYIAHYQPLISLWGIQFPTLTHPHIYWMSVVQYHDSVNSENVNSRKARLN